MDWVICCDVCRTAFPLTESMAVACTEVATFAEIHAVHEVWALAIRTEQTCPCRDEAPIKPPVPRLTLVVDADDGPCAPRG